VFSFKTTRKTLLSSHMKYALEQFFTNESKKQFLYSQKNFWQAAGTVASMNYSVLKLSLWKSIFYGFLMIFHD
jgi:hypothetical protein